MGLVRAAVKTAVSLPTMAHVCWVALNRIILQPRKPAHPAQFNVLGAALGRVRLSVSRVHLTFLLGIVFQLVHQATTPMGSECARPVMLSATATAQVLVRMRADSAEMSKTRLGLAFPLAQHSPSFQLLVYVHHVMLGAFMVVPAPHPYHALRRDCRPQLLTPC